MADKFKVKIDYPRLVKQNRKRLSKQVDATASTLASKVRDRVPDDVPVTVTKSEGSIGQPVRLVTIAHASGLARQAKHGDLTGAAAEMGLDLHRRKG